MEFNSLKTKKNGAVLNVDYSKDFEGIADKKEVIALALLTGAFNPLRKHSTNDKPIDLDKLKEYKTKFDNLLWEVSQDLDVDVNSISDIK